MQYAVGYPYEGISEFSIQFLKTFEGVFAVSDHEHDDGVKLMGFEDIVTLMDAVAPAPKRPAVYKRKPLQISN